MIDEKITRLAPEFVTLRRDLHRHPELQFKERRTSAIVAEKLREYGYRVETGWAETGVVGILQKGKSHKTIALRADMDALPIQEQTDLPYTSSIPGVMHACGHDGHTATLLAAAKYLAEDGTFDGTLHLIFQPAEEDISGAKRMIEEGLFKRFPVDGVFALHNIPGWPLGRVGTRAGAITAEVSIVGVTVKGIGGHGALPHLTADPVVAASSIVLALQTAVSRNLDPLDLGVVTVGAINGGVLGTIIPSEVNLKIGVRTVSAEASALMAKRLPEIMKHQAQSYGCEAIVTYPEGYVYPAGHNDPELVNSLFALTNDRGQDRSNTELQGPFMFSEDFAFMQQAVKGCFFGIGNGSSRNLHDPGYDFNDELITAGGAIWVQLVEQRLAS